jgi:hypothetical protein
MNTHDLDVAVQINNIQQEENHHQYDLSRISKEDKDRLMKLLSKAVKTSKRKKSEKSS